MADDLGGLPACTCSSVYGSERCQRLRLIREVLGDASRELRYLDSGMSRSVYASVAPGWVIKLPRSCGWVQASLDEWRMIQTGRWPTPQTYLEWYRGLPVIHQEEVDARYFSDLPLEEREQLLEEAPWVDDFALDDQIGFTKDGRVVAYDLGHAISQGSGQLEEYKGGKAYVL